MSAGTCVAFLLSLIAPQWANAQFTIATNNNTITITGYIGTNTFASIPSTTNGLPVTSIGPDAFYNQTKLTSISIPSSITNIGDSAFASCTSLPGIVIPNSVLTLGGGILDGCTNLTSATLPVGITNIPGSTFANCNLASFTIPPGVTAIGDYAFRGCPLTNIYLPSAVASIGSYTFLCYDLTSFTVSAQNSVYSAVNGVLFNKNQTTIVIYPAGITGGYTVPNGVTNIGAGAFTFGTNLTAVTLPSGFTSIGAGAFEYCSGLASATIPGTATSIGQLAFADTGLTTLAIPSGVTNIGAQAFNTCTHLTSVSIPASVISLGASAFNYCLSLSAINVAINNAFYTSVGGVLFNKNGTQLIQYPVGNPATNYALPDGVASLATEAFAYSPYLQAVTLPASVTSLGSDAFYYCTTLTNFYFQGNAPGADGSEFGGDTGTVHYLSGTTGWAMTFGGLPTAILTLSNPVISSSGLGIQTNSFGFNVSLNPNETVIVEATTNLTNPTWQPLQTNTATNGTFYFSDPQWTNFPRRFYRLVSP